MPQSHFTPVQGGALAILTLVLHLRLYAGVRLLPSLTLLFRLLQGIWGIIEPRHMGDHLVWGGKCDFNPDYRLAGKTFWRSAVIFNLNTIIRPACLLALWHFT